MIDYVKLFSNHPLNIVPELIKDCDENSVWHILSDFIRSNYTQDIIKASYLLVLDSYKDFCLIKNENIFIINKYLLHIDILWQALSDENCAKLELHIRQ